MSKQILVGKLDVRYRKKNGETYPFIVLECQDGEVEIYEIVHSGYAL